MPGQSCAARWQLQCHFLLHRNLLYCAQNQDDWVFRTDKHLSSPQPSCKFSAKAGKDMTSAGARCRGKRGFNHYKSTRLCFEGGWYQLVQKLYFSQYKKKRASETLEERKRKREKGRKRGEGEKKKEKKQGKDPWGNIEVVLVYPWHTNLSYAMPILLSLTLPYALR